MIMAEDIQTIANTEGSNIPSVSISTSESTVNGLSVDAVMGDSSAHANTAQDEIAKILDEVGLSERRQPQNETVVLKSPTPQPVPSTTPAPVLSMQDAMSAITSVRTLKQDVQSAVRNNDISVVRAIAMEETKRSKGSVHRNPTPAATARSKRTMSILFISFIFLLLTAGALASVWVAMQQRAPVSLPPPTSIIFAEQTLPLALDNESSQTLKNILAQARVTLNAPLGSITRVVPTISTTTEAGMSTQPATLREFLTATAINPPDELLRAMGNQFFLGIHAVNKNVPVLVISISSYNRAFAGMLAWESSMNTDLTPAYIPVPRFRTDTSGLQVARTFEDIVLRNYDVRALKDDAGDIMLYYSFPTPNILIIAESPYTFTEVLSRLQARRQL